MNTCRRMLVALVACWSCLAYAQGNLGALLESGARRIPRDELVALLSGLVMSGESFNNAGGVIRFEYSGDGTVSGYLRTADGREFPSRGTWQVDEAGKFCRAMIRANGSHWGDCRYFFTKEGEYFATETEDRAAKVEKRVFE